MARLDVKSFQKIEKSKNTVHSKVSATYSVFENEGEKYLQVDTYGKDDEHILANIARQFK